METARLTLHPDPMDWVLKGPWVTGETHDDRSRREAIMVFNRTYVFHQPVWAQGRRDHAIHRVQVRVRTVDSLSIPEA